MFNQINLSAINRSRWNFRGSVIHLSSHQGKSYKDTCFPGRKAKAGTRLSCPRACVHSITPCFLCCYVILKFVWKFQMSIIHQLKVVMKTKIMGSQKFSS